MQSPQTGQPAESAGSAATNQSNPGANSTQDDSRTQWLGKIPYDVFYDQPAAMIGGPVELGAATAAPNMVAATPQPAETTASATAASGDTTQWSTLIPGMVLDEEAKLIRSRLTSNLQTVATYNNSIDAVSTDTLVLAALAGIAERTDGEVRWKDRAPVVRQLSYDVWSAVGSRGMKAFRETQLPFEKLRDAMDGARVEADADPDVPMNEYADRSSMMIRIKQSSDWLRTNVSTEKNLSDDAIKRDVIREASLLAALGQVVAQPDYDYAEEDEYTQMTRDFVQAALGMREAAETEDFAKYQSAYKGMMKQCGVCHARYQFQ